MSITEVYKLLGPITIFQKGQRNKFYTKRHVISCLCDCLCWISGQYWI